eukprot:6469958-Amphidinium_carterae.1
MAWHAVAEHLLLYAVMLYSFMGSTYDNAIVHGESIIHTHHRIQSQIDAPTDTSTNMLECSFHDRQAEREGWGCESLTKEPTKVLLPVVPQMTMPSTGSPQTQYVSATTVVQLGMPHPGWASMSRLVTTCMSVILSLKSYIACALALWRTCALLHHGLTLGLRLAHAAYVRRFFVAGADQQPQTQGDQQRAIDLVDSPSVSFDERVFTPLNQVQRRRPFVPLSGAGKRLLADNTQPSSKLPRNSCDCASPITTGELAGCPCQHALQSADSTNVWETVYDPPCAPHCLFAAAAYVLLRQEPNDKHIRAMRLVASEVWQRLAASSEQSDVDLLHAWADFAKLTPEEFVMGTAGCGKHCCRPGNTADLDILARIYGFQVRLCNVAGQELYSYTSREDDASTPMD